MAKERVAAVDGFVTLNPEAPRLLGTRCGACWSYFFPAENVVCRNPSCRSAQLEKVELAPRGKVWSYTNTCYKPPPPYVAEEPFVPFVIAAVELAEEKLVVLGQMLKGTELSSMKIGMDVELRLETLYEDDDKEYITWKWAPAAP